MFSLILKQSLTKVLLGMYGFYTHCTDDETDLAQDHIATE